MNHILARFVGAGIVLLLGGVFTPTGPPKPNFHGNWTNETLTRLERAGEHEALTDQEAAAIEQEADQPWLGELFSEPGNDVIRINGEARSSIIIAPSNGRLPPRTEAGKQRLAEMAARRTKFGEFDHPEMRPLAERCLVSFGSNAGPPMLPNYHYNNNYTIVQSADHIMILTEMNHDARIVRMGATTHLPEHVRPWFGDSIGRWEGDTLVVETTNIHPAQLAQTEILKAYRGASQNLKVTERLRLTQKDTIMYRFTVEDLDTFEAPFTGELLFRRTDGMIYEYACHESNYSIGNILTAARAKERRDAARRRRR